MKKLLTLALAFLLVFTVAHAETNIDIASMTEEELLALRLAINTELGTRREEQLSIEEGMTIAEIFPDEWLAKNIRDKLGKFSTKNVVTQAEMDSITSLRISGQTTEHIQVTTLEGIQYLHGLTSLEINDQKNIHEIPEWIGTLTNLRYLQFRYCDAITIVPDSICNLINLTSLDLERASITSLPADIGNLVNLTELDISRTKITELPESIYNLNLTTFNRAGLDID